MLNKIKEYRKIMYGLVAGLFLSLAVVTYGADLTQNNSWNFGNGWLWFTQNSLTGKVRGNVQAPLDPSNIATKSYVDAAGSGSSGSTPVIFYTDKSDGYNLDAKCDAVMPGAIATRADVMIWGDFILTTRSTGWIEMDDPNDDSPTKWTDCDSTIGTFHLDNPGDGDGVEYGEVDSISSSGINCSDLRPVQCIKY